MQKQEEFSILDAHTHLLDYPEGQLQQVIKAAKQAGVRHIVCNTTKPDDYAKLELLSQKYSTHVNIVSSFGVHPWYMENIKDSQNWLSDLEAKIKEKQSNCVGEIGLDFRKNILEKNPKQTQTKVFEDQFALAVKYKRPVSIHSVHAHGEMLKFFKKTAKLVKEGPHIIMHSYGGSKQITTSLLKLSSLPIFFSLSLKRNEDLCSVIPLDRLLLQSDAPYQLDKPIVNSDVQFQKQDFKYENEPRFIKVNSRLAKLYGIPVNTFFEQVWKNSLRAFRLII